MRRVAVIGSSGAGKSTLATALAERLAIPAIKLDALMRGSDWIPTPTPEFRSKVIAALAKADASDGGWVASGNYRTVADITQRGADTIVWLDLPRRGTMWRLFKRSVRRSVTRKNVCASNRESLANLVSRDPNRNVLLWSWRSIPRYQQIYEGYASGEFWSHATVHRLRTRSDVAKFRDSVSG